MKSKHMLVCMGMLAILGAPCVASAKSGDDAQIKALEARFADAVRAKDVDAIMKCYVPDDTLFVFDVVPPRQYVGATAYRKDWADFLKTFSGPVKFDISDLAVSNDGTLGYGHSAQHIVGKDAKGQPIEYTVRASDVYRKIGGQWLIVMEHVSVPVDMDTLKPDMMSKM